MVTDQQVRRLFNVQNKYEYQYQAADTSRHKHTNNITLLFNISAPPKKITLEYRTTQLYAGKSLKQPDLTDTPSKRCPIAQRATMWIKSSFPGLIHKTVINLETQAIWTKPLKKASFLRLQQTSPSHYTINYQAMSSFFANT